MNIAIMDYRTKKIVSHLTAESVIIRSTELMGIFKCGDCPENCTILNMTTDWKLTRNTDNIIVIKAVKNEN